jgi:2-desacetyl-2-hydroxyethyl bacteriochlorophyllide A dehydrogenase
MKAAVFLKDRKIEVQNVAEPDPKDNEVLIKVDGCGLCGTDVHLYEGAALGVKPPVAFGHEITGTVAATGRNVKDLKIGHRVAVDPVVTCGSCRFCQIGRPNLCPNMTVVGYVIWGGFAEYCCVPRSYVYPMSNTVTAKAGILAETLACVINGYERLKIETGSTVLVVGAGSVGLLWNNMIKHSCTSSLCQVDIVAERIERAKGIGADAVDLVGNPDLNRDFEKKYNDGFDVVVDCTGEGGGVKWGLSKVRPGGKFMIFGVCNHDVKVEISPFELLWNEISIITAKMPPKTLGKAVRLIEAGIIDADQIVTSEHGLSDVESCINKFRTTRQTEVKMMINPTMG